MTRRTVPLKLVPPGLTVDRHEIGAGGVVVHARSASAASPCRSRTSSGPAVMSTASTDRTHDCNPTVQRQFSTCTAGTVHT